MKFASTILRLAIAGTSLAGITAQAQQHEVGHLMGLQHTTSAAPKATPVASPSARKVASGEAPTASRGGSGGGSGKVSMAQDGFSMK